MKGGEQGPGLLFHFFFWKENGGKTEDRSPHPLGLWGIPLRLVQGVGSLGSGWDPCCSGDDWEALNSGDSAAVFLQPLLYSTPRPRGSACRC